jgi:hypothetical protein
MRHTTHYAYSAILARLARPIRPALTGPETRVRFTSSRHTIVDVTSPFDQTTRSSIDARLSAHGVSANVAHRV